MLQFNEMLGNNDFITYQLLLKKFNVLPNIILYNNSMLGIIK
jgi:hypothetical protein